MDIHMDNLKQLCRICGILLSRTKKIRLHIVADYANRLEMAFRQAVFLDREDVHPKGFCHTCYRAMTK